MTCAAQAAKAAFLITKNCALVNAVAGKSGVSVADTGRHSGVQALYPFAFQDMGMSEPPRWLTRAFSLLERDDLSVDLRQLHTLQKVEACLIIFYLISGLGLSQEGFSSRLRFNTKGCMHSPLVCELRGVFSF